MAELLSAEAVRVGAVRGRYFRENFAQRGIDLVQIVPELVTNADAAIAASGRSRGRIEVRFGTPDPAFLAAWRAQMRALRVPALRSWRFEVSCADDGIGVNAAAVDRRLGALPEQGGQRKIVRALCRPKQGTCQPWSPSRRRSNPSASPAPQHLSSMPSRPDFDCSWAEPGDMLALMPISTPLDLKSCHLLEGLPRLSLWSESGHKP
jgi:hypothetical protein